MPLTNHGNRMDYSVARLSLYVTDFMCKVTTQLLSVLHSSSSFYNPDLEQQVLERSRSSLWRGKIGHFDNNEKRSALWWPVPAGVPGNYKLLWSSQPASQTWLLLVTAVQTNKGHHHSVGAARIITQYDSLSQHQQLHFTLTAGNPTHLVYYRTLSVRLGPSIH